MRLRSLPVTLLRIAAAFAVFAWHCTAADTPSGYSSSPGPLELKMARAPEIDLEFRRLVGDWHGAPGLPKLRERWDRFSAAEPGFAVLSALLDEADGRLEEALRRLAEIKGDAARWHTARLQALSGQEKEAVASFSEIVKEATNARTAAEALMALTELDCIRGDFAPALQRTKAAWQDRPEEAFRLFILERHISLLLEAGEHEKFIQDLLAAAQKTGSEQTVSTDGKALGLLSQWFPGDERLVPWRQRMSFAGISFGKPVQNPIPSARSSIECGTPNLSPVQLEALSGSPDFPIAKASGFLARMSSQGEFPAALTDLPWLESALKARPMTAAGALLGHTGRGGPIHAMAIKASGLLPDGAPQIIAGIIAKRRAGQPVPDVREQLLRILTLAPAERLRVDAEVERGWSIPPCSPTMKDLLTGRVIWNLNGPEWTAWYGRASSWALLMTRDYIASFYPAQGLTTPANWQPDWPKEGMDSVITWAWKHLDSLGMAGPVTAVKVAEAMPSVADRLTFAALCRQSALLIRLAGDPALLTQADSRSLLRAADALTSSTEQPSGPHAAAVKAIATVLAPRFGLAADDLLLTRINWTHLLPPAEQGALENLRFDAAAAQTLGASGAVEGVRRAASAGRLKSAPHPLYELPVCPSVERFRTLRQILEAPDKHRPPRRDKASEVLRVTLEWAGHTGEKRKDEPDFMDVVRAFPTANPVAAQAVRWQEIWAETLDLQQPRTGTVPQKKLQPALQKLAGEYRERPEWEFIAAMLEPDAGKREELLRAITSYNPLAARLPSKIPGLAGLVPPAPAPALHDAGTTTAILVKFLEDPERRKLLTPAGAVSPILTSSLGASFMHAVNLLTREQKEALGSILLEWNDPLAARVAVAATSMSQDPKPASLLRKALRKFPDDPELLLALTFCEPEVQAEEASAALEKALQAVTGIHKVSERGEVIVSPVYWCGMKPIRKVRMEDVGKITKVAARLAPGTLPAEWEQAMDSAFERESRNAPGIDLMAICEALLRHGGAPSGGWNRALGALKVTGKKSEARALAEILLLRLAGPLADEVKADPMAPWVCISGTESLGPGAEGWRLLESARGENPNGLAQRLRQAADAQPANEQLNFAALLAAGLERQLNDADIAALRGLKPQSRNLAIAWAAYLLPPARVPPSALPDALLAAAEFEFSVVWNGYRNFKQGLTWLGKLETTGATEQIRKGRTAAITAMPAAGGLPPEFISSFSRQLAIDGTPEMLANFEAAIIALTERGEKLPSYPERLAHALHFLNHTKRESQEALVSRVSRLLDEVAKEGHKDYRRLASLLEEAGDDPRWHARLRSIIENQRKDPKARPCLDRLAMKLDLAEDPEALPEVELSVESAGAGASGEADLHWHIHGFANPAPFTKGQPAAPVITALAAALGGKFDAAVYSAPLPRGSEPVLIAELPSFAASGKVRLKNLPAAGFISVRWTHRDKPELNHSSRPVYFSDKPVLIDTARPPSGRGIPPPGWEIRGGPVPLSDAAAWHIYSPSAAARGDLQESPSAILLFDSEGRICAMENVQAHAARSELVLPGGPGTVISSTSWRPTIDGEGERSAEINPTLEFRGPPVSLALAGIGGPESASGRPAARTILQEWHGPTNQPGVAETKCTQLAMLGQWQLASAVPPAITTGSPARAAFTAGSSLWILPLEGTPAIPAPQQWPLPEKSEPVRLDWAGKTLWRQSLRGHRGTGKESASSMEAIRPGAPDWTAGPFEFPLAVRFWPCPEAKIIMVSGNSSLLAVLTDRGCVRIDPDSETMAQKGIEIQYADPGAQQLICRLGGARELHVVDWSGETLRIYPFEGKKPDQRRDYSGAQRGEMLGTFTFPAGPFAGTYRSPCILSSLFPLAKDRFVGLTETGIVLMKPVPE